MVLCKCHHCLLFFFSLCDLAGWRSKSFSLFSFLLAFDGIVQVPSLILYIVGKVRNLSFFFFPFSFFLFSFSFSFSFFL